MVAVIEQRSASVRSEVLDALAARAIFESSDLHVEEAGGIVTLTGVVDCQARSVAAETAARDVVGVRDVVNDIRIARDRIYGWRDVDLLDKALRILGAHYLFAGARIGVAAENGFVILTGRVSSLFERMEAERAISFLPNLVGIRNEIQVFPPRVEPDLLRREIREALGRLLGSTADSVEVAVEGNTVTLRGEVRSGRDRAACLDAVSALRGVARVHDHLVAVGGR
jgi:osmotically-inducible protein OsmY